jgi:hypothetical protein
MRTRVQWQGTVPAGADAEKNFVIGGIPEGKTLIVSAASYYGGDAGERYSINLIPASQAIEDATVDADIGHLSYAYPMAGGNQTNATPIPITQFWTPQNPIPGPCTVTVATITATAAVFVVNMLGYLEDL